MDWKLENGTPVTQEDLAEEITRVPRTRFWRLSHMAFLWPADADPAGTEPGGGFAEGFVLEIVAVDQGVEWLLQPVAGDAQDRIRGAEKTGRLAVAAAFEQLERLVTERRAAAPASPGGPPI